jgi:hypothetical protein
MCKTIAFVIQLRAVSAGSSAPGGYQSTGWTIGGVVIYYTLTAT